MSNPSWGVLVLCFAVGVGIVALALRLKGQNVLLDFANGLRAFSIGRYFKARRRAKLLRQPFPLTWLKYLQQNVRDYGLLNLKEQERLREDLRVFIAEKKWEGCRGLMVTDEIKVTIAAQACLLLLGLEHDYYEHVSAILVYPSTFRDPEGRFGPDGLIHDQPGNLGEAWYRGPVVLAWDEVLAGGRGQREGQNVVYHEFAHQLDFLGDWGNRQTRPKSQEQWERWQGVLREEYQWLVRDSEMGWATLLDQYGATNPAEFFAVATECFFERPVALRQRQPRLYEVLRDFYGQDPAERALRR